MEITRWNLGCRLLEEDFTNKLERKGSLWLKALHTSAHHSLSSCVLCFGHTHYASGNAGLKELLFKVFKRKKGAGGGGDGKEKRNKQTNKTKRDRLTFWSQIFSLLENVHSCLVNQRLFWEKKTEVNKRKLSTVAYRLRFSPSMMLSHPHCFPRAKHLVRNGLSRLLPALKDSSVS